MSLVVKNIYHTYQLGTPNESHALQDVSIEINDGEFIGIIGHTGSGKSTLVQHLNGLLKPSSGQILVDGKDIHQKGTQMKSLRLQVGMVFQYPEHQLFEETVEKDIAFGPRNLGLSEAEITKRVKEAMEIVNLDYKEFRKKSPFSLSGGQKRRIAIAGVLAIKPKYLILDEPTAGLDPKGRDEILAQVKQLHEQLNITIIMVSHSMDDVARYAQRMVVMDHGKIRIQGTPQEVFQSYDLLVEIGVGVPTVTTLLRKLQQRGLDVRTDLITVEDAKDEILRALSAKEASSHA